MLKALQSFKILCKPEPAMFAVPLKVYEISRSVNEVNVIKSYANIFSLKASMAAAAAVVQRLFIYRLNKHVAQIL